MKKLTYLLLFIFTFSSCHAQTNNKPNRLVGGPCEGCEAVFEYGNKNLTATDTLPHFQDHEPKLKITGTVFQRDGSTPAKNVILYIYHTNRSGIYETRGGEKGWAKRHGIYRGWIKTGSDGKYTFYTFRPASYPNSQEPEHIHLTIKEPDKNEYYADEYVFVDDPLLTESAKGDLAERCGSGITQPKFQDGLMTIERDIVLGINIPNYE